MKSTDTIYKEDRKTIHYLLKESNQDTIRMVDVLSKEKVVLQRM